MADKKSSPTRITLKNVRLSYPHLWKPQKFDDNDGGNPKYNCSGIIDPDTKWGKANIAKIEDAIDYAMDQKWPKKRPNLKDEKMCLREGNDKEDVPPEYEDMLYISASNDRQPLIIDRDGTDLIEEDDVIYAGCFVDMIVDVWAQDNKYGKRVNASLEAVRFRDDGDALTSARRATADDFDDDDEDDDDRGSSRRSSRRSRDEDDDDRGSRRGRRGRGRDDDDEDEDEDEDRGSRRGRGRGRSRDDDEDEDEDRGSKRRGRGRSRDDDDEDEDEDRGSRRGRGRRSRDDDDEDEDEDRGSRRGRGRRSRDDDDEEEPKSRRRGRSRGRSRDDDDDIA